MPERRKSAPIDLNDNPDFEIVLENTLRPVEPNPDFIHHLRERLVKTPEVAYDPGGISDSQLTMVVVTVMLIALVISALVAVGRLLGKTPRR